MKYLVYILLLLPIFGYSQGGGIRYVDVTPTHTPNTLTFESIIYFNRSDSTYYQYKDGAWRDMDYARVVDSAVHIVDRNYAIGEEILNLQTGARYFVSSDSVSGYVNDTIAVIPVGGNYAILQPQNEKLDLRWFGGNTSGNNSVPLQKAVDFAAGNAEVLIPQGVYEFDSTLLLGDKGVIIRGLGSNNDDAVHSVLRYTGTGDAISYSSQTSGWGKLILENFALYGTDTARHAINMDFSTHGGLLIDGYTNNLRIEDFSQDSSYAIYATRVYNHRFENINITDCWGGYYLGTETVALHIKDNWIRNADGFGVYNVYGGNTRISGGVIDHVGTPGTTQRAIYQTGGEIDISNILMEGNYMHIDLDAGRASITGCKFNTSTANSNIADGVRARLLYNILPFNQGIDVGLGTEWYGDIEGNHVKPSITADNPVGFSTVTYLDGSAGAFTISEYATNGVPDGAFTLYFLDDSVTIDHNTASNEILLQGAVDFTGSTGDRITFMKLNNSGGTCQIIEISRSLVNPPSDSTIFTGGQINTNTTIDLNANLYIDDPGGGSLTVGNTVDYGRGKIETDGTMYALNGFATPNDAWYKGYDPGGNQDNLLRINSDNDIQLGTVTGDNVLITAGTVTSEYINWNVGNADQMRLMGSGELRLGAVGTDQGTYDLQVEDSVYIGGNIEAIDHKQYGNQSSSTDGSGDLTVTFSTAFSSAPDVVMVTGTGTTGYIYNVTAITATTFTVRVIDTANAAVTSTAVDFYWLAIR